jgi:glycosyltransferase involved in cell wall biosynthesis
MERGGWVTYSPLDILYMERPTLPSFLEGIKLAKNYSIPVWVDFDDDLWNVPKYNPSYDFYSQESTKENIKECISLADLITVTSQSLKDTISKYNKNVHIIPNAWNDYNFKWNINFSTKEIVNWRGSGTHSGDLQPYKKAFIELQKYKNWKWSFMGADHEDVSDEIDSRKKIIFKQTNIISYFNQIRDLSPGIQCVPLAFNVFNESKSNIAWIEGTYAGAATLAPFMEQWKRSGIKNYSGADEFLDALEELMKNDKYRKKLWKESYEYIGESLLLSKVNQKRKELALQLV